MAELATAHGTLVLPAFLPDATRGVVRTVGSDELSGVGVAGLCVNAFHLAESPGAKAVAQIGGIHRFMSWNQPILSDSGGFQIYSLLRTGQNKGSVQKDGFRFKNAQGEKKILTPEKAVRRQVDLGADLIVALDHCTHQDETPEAQRESVEHTVNWARLGKLERDRIAEQSGRRPLLIAVIQGGNDLELRRTCAERLLEIGFDGYAFGGWPVTDEGVLLESVEFVASLVPRNLPLWGLGIGKPEHVVRAASFGYTIFDCVIPTRDARHGRLFVLESATGRGGDYRCVYPKDRRRGFRDEPVDPSCDCPLCRNYSLAYLHHLFMVKDALASRLATLHNLRFYARLMDRLRT